MKNILFVSLVLIAATTLVISAPPPNDNFAGRETISGANGTVSGSNVDATLEPGEAHYGNSNTVWWSWTPPSYASYQVDTFGSSYDTYLAIFTGNSVSSLSLRIFNDDALGTKQSAVCLVGGSDTAFQIQVSGNNPVDVGSITLNWHAITNWSDWIFGSYYTDSFFYVVFGNDLSAISFAYLQAWESWYRTNELGCEDWKYHSKYVYTNGFTVTDKNNNKRIDDKMPEGINTNFSFEDYNGKQMLLHDVVSNKLVVYITVDGDFVKSSEREIADFGAAWCYGSEIMVFLMNANGEGIKAFDKKLKKEKWSVPADEGDIRTLGKGIVARIVENNNVRTITCRKKGKVVSQHIITNPVNADLYLKFDPKGGVLYWTKREGTNSPLTYIDRKGMKILDSQSLPEVGDVWNCESFDGKTLYVRKPLGGGTNTFYAYKVKGLQYLGRKDVDGYPRLEADRKVYIFTYPASGSGLIVCDKKLAKEKWRVPPEDGEVTRLARKIFVRRARHITGNIVTDTYKLFTRKREIVTYEFSYPK